MILPIWLSRLRADILHAPAFVGPVFSPCPQVITVHDLSFIRYPHFFKGPNRLYLSLMTGFSCRRAAAVIAVSEFTASEVKRLLRVKPGKIHTVYHGVDQRFKPLPQNAIDAFKSRKGLPERFILFLGTLEPRKNLIQLVRAYAKLPQKSTHLILAGAQGWFYQELYAVVEELGLQKYVHFPGYISGEEQVLWYNAASVFAYVSTYEGFGLPVLEALACGVPTLTSTSSSLPEAAGNGALQAKSDDEQDIADKLTLLLANSELRESLRLNGLEHASHFTWELTAQKTRRVYTDVLNRN
jgi:glycosyltransferase involved in cell wall biosynthesis